MKRNSPASYTNFDINKNERGEQGNERWKTNKREIDKNEDLGLADGRRKETRQGNSVETSDLTPKIKVKDGRWERGKDAISGWGMGGRGGGGEGVSEKCERRRTECKNRIWEGVGGKEGKKGVGYEGERAIHWLSLIPLFTRSLTYWFTHSLIHPFIDLQTHSLTHSFIDTHAHAREPGDKDKKKGKTLRTTGKGNE